MKKKYWCSLVLDAQHVRAAVIPLGAGKFKIVTDEGGKHIDKIIDASDVIYCDTEMPLEQDSKLESFCRDILSLHGTIRFACVANSIGSVIAAVYREGVIPLIPKQEFSQRSVFSTIRENFESRIGFLQYVIGRYEKLVYGILPIGIGKEFYLVLSFDTDSDVEMILKDRIIPAIKMKELG